MKKYSLKSKGDAKPAISMIAKIAKMHYDDVMKGQFVKMSKKDDSVVDLAGSEALTPEDKAAGIKVTTPVGERTLDANTYEIYNRVFKALTDLSTSIINKVDFIGQEAYSGLIDLHEHVDYIVSLLEADYKKLVSRLLDFITKDGTRMGDIYMDIKHMYTPYHFILDRLSRRIHFRKDEADKISSIRQVVSQSLDTFTHAVVDDADKVSVILPNAELPDSEEVPTKVAADEKSIAKKS